MKKNSNARTPEWRDNLGEADSGWPREVEAPDLTSNEQTQKNPSQCVRMACSHSQAVSRAMSCKDDEHSWTKKNPFSQKPVQCKARKT